MVALTIFMGFNVVYAHCTTNFGDSFCSSSEVLTVTCLFYVGFIFFWFVFRAAKYNQDEWLAVALHFLIGQHLLILITIDYQLERYRSGLVSECIESVTKMEDEGNHE